MYIKALRTNFKSMSFGIADDVVVKVLDPMWLTVHFESPDLVA